MTVASEITKLQSNLSDCYTAVSNKGGTMPASENFDNLATAISSISLGYFEIPSYTVSSGVVSRRSLALSSTSFSDITEVASGGMQYAFYDCQGMTGALDMSNLVSISGNGMLSAFWGTGITSVDMSALTTIGASGLYEAFRNCTYLTSADFSSLTTVGMNGLLRGFEDSGLTSVTLSSLSSVDNSGLQNAFDSCPLTTVNLTVLDTIGNRGLRQAFSNVTTLTDVYFNALKTTTFATYVNQFDNMLQNTGSNVTHTLHFPSNLETTIQGLDGYPNFGGTSGYVTLAFDLPATS